MITHLTLDGDFAECDGQACPLKFHFPDVTPEQMATVPERVLWDLCEAIDPPKRHPDGSRAWFIEIDGNRDFHRDYDLPALFSAQGHVDWYRQGRPHRGYDRPAQIQDDGALTWYVDGDVHRDGDKPARITRTGRQEWYQHNELSRPAGGPNVVKADGTQQWWVDGELIRDIGPDGVETVAEEGTFLLG